MMTNFIFFPAVFRGRTSHFEVSALNEDKFVRSLNLSG